MFVQLIPCRGDDCTKVCKAGIPKLLSVEHSESVNYLVAKVGPFKSLYLCFVLEKMSWGHFVMYCLILSSIFVVWVSGRKNMLLFGISFLLSLRKNLRMVAKAVGKGK